MENYIVNNCPQYVDYLRTELLVDSLLGGFFALAFGIGIGVFGYFMFKSMKYYDG